MKNETQNVASESNFEVQGFNRQLESYIDDYREEDLEQFEDLLFKNEKTLRLLSLICQNLHYMLESESFQEQLSDYDFTSLQISTEKLKDFSYNLEEIQCKLYSLYKQMAEIEEDELGGE